MNFEKALGEFEGNREFLMELLWKLMEDVKAQIENIHKANAKLKKNCKIAMDLGGPKLRSGQMVPGPKVINIKPRRDDLGKVIQPSNIWIALPDVPPPVNAEVDVILPVHEALYKQIKRGNTLRFIDSRGKKGKIVIDRNPIAQIR